MNQEFVGTIKSRGYWRINFQPLILEQKIKTLDECRKVVEKNAVNLRGWDYPHFPKRQGEDAGLEPCGPYYQGWVDWNGYKEFWRIYKSGQFLHYRGLNEDWLEEDSWKSGMTKDIKPGEKLSVIGSVNYQITEVFEFLSRLASEGIYDEGVKVVISLKNTKNRELKVFDLGRVPLPFSYKTGAQNIVVERELSKEQLITNPKKVALLVILEIFNNFGWNNPSIETIKKDQDNLYAGRL